MKIRNQLLINGKWRDSSDGSTFDVINPATNKVITAVQKASRSDIQDAVDAARRAFTTTWRAMNPFERSALMHKAADIVAENA
jgi:aldehyde dehydrogenase (NAD+)